MHESLYQLLASCRNTMVGASKAGTTPSATHLRIMRLAVEQLEQGWPSRMCSWYNMQAEQRATTLLTALRVDRQEWRDSVMHRTSRSCRLCPFHKDDEIAMTCGSKVKACHSYACSHQSSYCTKETKLEHLAAPAEPLAPPKARREGAVGVSWLYWTGKRSTEASPSCSLHTSAASSGLQAG